MSECISRGLIEVTVDEGRKGGEYDREGEDEFDGLEEEKIN